MPVPGLRDTLNISEDTINQIKERANIVAVIGDYVNLKQSGQNHKGLCPFHSEKTPSFMVSPGKGIFHCFGCGVGGNVFHFLMKFKGISFPDAVRLLGERVGVSVETRPGEDANRSRFETLYQINTAAAGFFEQKLYSAAGTHALNYLLARKLTPPILREFCMGFAEEAWDALFSFLRSKGFRTEDIEETGLIVKKKMGPGHYDRFRNRIMFPIYDTIGRCIGFGGRTLEKDKPEIPKYVNTNENTLYHKGRFLFGVTNAQEAIRKENRVIIVEGYVDVVRMHQEGFKCIVAPLGTALTGEQIALIGRHTKNIYLAFDSDEAGVKAALRSAMLMLGCGIDPQVIRLPAGRDPGDFFDEYTREDFELLIQDAVYGIQFVVESYAGARKDYSANEKIVILTQLIDFYDTINDEILRLSFLEALTKALNVQKVVLERELDKLKHPPRRIDLERKPVIKKGAAKGVAVSHELYLLLLLLANPDLFPLVNGRLDGSSFKGTWTRKLWDAISRASERPGWDSGTVFDYLNHHRFIEYLSGKLMNEALAANPRAQAIDLTASLKERVIRDRLGGINAGLSNAEIENDDVKINRLMVEKQACTNDLEKIRLLRASKTAL